MSIKISESIEFKFSIKIKVDRKSGCWVWTGARDRDGYGRFAWREPRGFSRAHRFSFYLKNKYLHIWPMQIDHICRNRSCVNPDHLESVTAKENVIRGNGPLKMRERRQAVKHCIHGHEFTEKNTRFYKRKEGYIDRQCRICQRIRNTKRRLVLKNAKV